MVDRDEVESYLGLDYFCVPHNGIGGVLKTRVDDFRVKEQAKNPSIDPKGRFTAIRVTLRNWETNRFIGRLASACKISRNRIFSSGLKDKRAVTTQILVVDASSNLLEKVDIPDSQIEILGRTHQKVSMGDHDGNRFTITVRGCASKDGKPLDSKEAMSRVLSIRSEMEKFHGLNAFPNWIGPQRFGSTRPVTPEVGRCVVNSDFKGAVSTYIGMQGDGHREDVESFRAVWRDTEDPSKCLEIIPKHLGFERAMLERLVNREDDYLGAFKSMPQSLQVLMVHSLQSLAFNHALRSRLSNSMKITKPSIGDIVAPLSENGRADIGKAALVSEWNLDRCAKNAERGRVAITGILPGNSVVFAEGEAGLHESEGVKSSGLENVDWMVPEIPRLSTNGTRRPLSVPFNDFTVEEAPPVPDDDLSERWGRGPRDSDRWHPDGACLRLRFVLPPGGYATVLMREFMRSPLDHY
ncbi:MAG: tRNA pseudouridine(13) synthase TruD [Euryarchaeota archaeon]|nr:tRNA pseudouridine(13) synthase TruD [Euryarchaeota archaeon]